MCVRYTGIDPKDEMLRERWERMGLIVPEDGSAGEVFPGEKGYVLRKRDEGLELANGQWGLMPHWTKDATFGKKNTFNARSETIHEKPSFRSAFKTRRCVLPASAFYEKKGGRWLRILPTEDELFWIAGLWEPGYELTDKLPTYTMVTTVPNTVMEPIHDRMPVILPESLIEPWMAADAPIEALQ